VSSVRIVPIDHHDLDNARRIHAVQMLAYAQEAELLQARHFPPLERTPADIQASQERFLAAVVDETLYGSIGLEPEDEPDHLTITSLVVSPAYQRRGVGRLLLAAVIRECAGSTLSASTGARNVPALALYRALGFVEHGRCTVGAEALELVTVRRAP
jgi:ribosomal protein S18 acetylase RimI-like enzyme